ncbi:GNAT family N-acetyltransferase [uncultured Pelagimonas sp.]|uniref:GNAT family N-acetyltransferase n=1 Tax=uncultured Pelagimonas sp. TaxID=1618102 RepID=UPI00262BE893|nr:GNAT family N-acetyltransferase [uncultured Pelagimonas sp.]
MSAIFLRPAHDMDAGRLGALITAAVAAHDWKPLLHSAAEDIAHAGHMIDRGWITVAEDETGQITGFISRDGTYVHALFIAEAAQGAGVGSALLDHAKTQADQLDLWTFVANRGARRFYKRSGFSEVERGDGSGNEEGLPDIHLLWEKPKVDAPTKDAPVDKTDAVEKTDRVELEDAHD